MRRRHHQGLAAAVAALLALPVLALSTLACAVGPLPSAAETPTPCSANCPPPQRAANVPHSVALSHFSLAYFDPWTVDSSSNSSVVLVAQTDYGQVSVQVASMTITPGTTAGQLVSRAAQQIVDANNYSGVNDNGPILGAEIGYVPGAGEAYSASRTDPNAPWTPVYVQVIASVRGNIALTFTALSPLDPVSRDPSGAPAQAYDQLVNSVEWT